MAKDEDVRLEDQKVLESLNDAIKKGPWENTLFLRAIGQKLQELRDRFSREMALDDSEQPQTDSASAAHLAAQLAKREGQVQVYVSLYNSEGGDFHGWERLIHGLGKQIISRPVFQNEDDVRELIRSKINKKNEAYVKVFVKKTDIMNPPGGKAPMDALGHQLLVLREGSANQANITAFMHQSGEYKIKDGRLIRVGDVQSSDFK